MTKNELKPCPFCGSRGQIKKHIFRGYPEGVFIVNCRGCHVEIAHDYKRRQSAVNAWNRRATE